MLPFMRPTSIISMSYCTLFLRYTMCWARIWYRNKVTSPSEDDLTSPRFVVSITKPLKNMFVFRDNVCISRPLLSICIWNEPIDNYSHQFRASACWQAWLVHHQTDLGAPSGTILTTTNVVCSEKKVIMALYYDRDHC